ncbi:ABC transporter ATP-binding protein [Desulfovibrio inopinatus]|uniref:ABC transporter ATP-binding protein n=1 Tax=Desulfovibrio inopinatus TaxID=102109 RepID=UPI000420993C|nr:ABC transporter ATP-binding protein [Desulfovibrio inopinatus]
MIPVYKLNETTIYIHGKRVLGPLDLTIQEGDFCIIVGPNGSGKTTLLRALVGHLRGYSGTIQLFGDELAGIPPAKLACTVSHLPQFPITDIPFSVEMVVQLGRAPRLGLFGIEQKQDSDAVEWAMEMTNVAHLRQRRLSTLSGGELSRTLLAQALCRLPKVLLLDEPTASLDPGHQMSIMNMLECMRTRHKMTIIMISHDLNIASTYGQSLVLLKNGTCIATGSPNAVLTTNMLSAVYDWDILVDMNPFTQKPRVSCLPGPKRP